MGLLVDDGWPSGFAFPEETEDVVRVVAMHETSHEVVLAGNVKPIRGIGCGNELVKVFAKLWSDEFVGIDNENPFMSGVVNGKLACGFNDVVFPFGKGDDTASEVCSDLHGGVG